MPTSAKGVAFIAAHEGVVTRAYRDVRGVWTIGVGHTAAAGEPRPKAGMTMSRAEVLALLATDLPRYEAGVAKALGETAATVFDGAVSFHFNTGAIGRASWVKKLRAGAPAEAEAALKLWNKSGGRIYKGLVRRRAEEADLIFRSAYPAAVEADARRAAASSPDEIAAVRTALAALGYLAGQDGIDAPAMDAAILAFQRDNDLVADGVAGPATRATLERRLALKRAERAVAAAGAAGAAGGSAGTAVADPSSSLETVLWIGAGGLAAAIAAALLLLAWRYRGAILSNLKSTIARRT